MQIAGHGDFASGQPIPAAESDTLAAFLDTVRAFLAAQLTPDLRAAGRETTGVHSEIAACRVWHRRLYEQGWIAPAWPVAQGGTGWDATRRFLFDRECAANDAPVLFATGIRSIGPLLLAAGTQEQKRRYIPPILSSDDLWCQGFSEANAGSDLAALAMRAQLDGDSYVVNGRKLWTTGAHLANRMFALARTQSAGKPQQGITFLLIDMRAPGITVRPIVTIDGQHEFNEVIFDDVRVSVDDRVGEENEGWAAARHLMRLARTNNTNSSHLRRAWRAVERALTRESSVEPGLCLRVTQTEAELVAFESLELAYLKSGRLSGYDEAGSSAMKLAATELHQRITELLLDVAGPYAAASPALPLDGHGRVTGGAFAARKYLATRAASIYSGTNEIHRNVIARQLIGAAR
jgi:acyl-CoA dehydrogenase